MNRDTQFSYNLRLLMAGLSGKPTERRDLAKAIDVTPDAITKYMSGERSPGREKVKAIAAYFGISIKRLAHSSLLLGPGKGPAKMLDLYEGNLSIPIESNRPVGTFTFETGDFAVRLPFSTPSMQGGGYFIMRRGIRNVEGEFILATIDGNTRLLRKINGEFIDESNTAYEYLPDDCIVGSIMYAIRDMMK